MSTMDYRPSQVTRPGAYTITGASIIARLVDIKLDVKRKGDKK